MFFTTRNQKIFCISFQRTGTTSTGAFFNDFGYKVATYPISRKNDWTGKWFKGDYETIFKSRDFKKYQVFEDNPWWCLDFYKVLFHRFPNAKFILLERDADEWFDSMVSHSKGKTLGNTHRHSILYNREEDFYNQEIDRKLYSKEIDNLLDLNEENREHYKAIYRNRNREVNVFFSEFGQDRLFTGELKDSNVWHEMSVFFGMKIPENYRSHKNASTQ
ncbi:hypothetical protein CW745_10395 [Psychromonas sp. psych-6C06]|uniref:sulfotransferase n=1 Tax=Psychromonas sp. psych-6C06 TaxID=2058089 RepID=UPI000C31D277|nr:sulfotransferase [Psychromonas sp. psych-6C06]PKF61720.1 hypothetical protein CW745_10395 [Psychromonas sp. psych-6C06]